MSGSEQESAGANRGRGEQHLDDREPLAYVYDGEELVASLMNRDVVEEFEEEEQFRWYTVSRTPHGEEVLEQ